jgi:hypothetical protein
MSIAEIFGTSGWLPVSGILEPEFVDELRLELERQFDTLIEANCEYSGYKQVGDGRVMLSVKLEGPFLRPELYANRMLVGILRELLGPEFLIDSLTSVVAMSGAADQELHRDVPALFPDSPKTSWHSPPYGVTAVIPLIDLTPETGTTRLFPGTHRGSPPGPDERPFVRRGDCFLMDVRLHHHGLANRSPTRRPVLYIVYSRPWFTDMTNFTRQPRINLGASDIPSIPESHRPLFRRVSSKGAADLTEEELLNRRK